MPAISNGTLRSWLEASPFQGYAYAYPHKTAYRPLRPARPLREVWAGEDRRQLFLYLHVPFCEMRCGFCNLFTTANPEEGLVARWLEALLRQARVTRDALGADAAFARGAIGGGTPTFLEEREMERLLAGLRALWSGALADTAFSVEMSPATISAEKLALLRAFGMRRASLGVQSFVEAEVRAAGRAQRNAEVHGALELMARSGVEVRNLDLIYGIPGQTRESWRISLEQAVAHAPEEIYLYPLYVRPLTGLDRLQREPADNRTELYREGRDWLLAHDYRQISMRLFRVARHAGVVDPPYVCQDDGMLGLGPGARSYTRALHYSGDYAVGRGATRQIVETFAAEDAAQLATVRYGVLLDDAEQRRRYLIKSLLRVEGLDAVAYRERFGSDFLFDWPQLEELAKNELGTVDAAGARLTSAGLEWSDAIGPWLYSEPMRREMAEFAWS